MTWGIFFDHLIKLNQCYNHFMTSGLKKNHEGVK